MYIDDVLAIRISLGLFGVLLGVFLQGYGLPIFLVCTLLLGWWLERGKPHREHRKSGYYISNLVFTYAAFILLIPLAIIFEGQTSEILKPWDNIALLSIKVFEVSYEPGTFRHEPAKLFMNLAAIVTPIFAAYSFHELKSPFPKKTIMAPRIVYLAIFTVPAILSLWGVSSFRVSTVHIEAGFFLYFAMQSFILIFLFRQL